MIIVSQDKDAIINSDNMANLVVLENNIVSICNIEETTGITIATYATEARAKEVLQAIVAAWQANKMLECCKNAITQGEMTKEFIKKEMTPFKYEMPAE